jgi:uncharacterized protein YgbK (DUF1537 family)
MQFPDLTIGVVADDLTGASDTALPFFLGHRQTHVIPGKGWQEALNRHQQSHDALLLGRGAQPEKPEAAQAWVVNTQTRHSTAAAAAEMTREAFLMLRDRLGVDLFYKKIDSTMRGQIAAECLAGVEALRADCALLVPAFPDQGRQTVGGYQMVRGCPLERSDVARDPLSPVGHSHVPTLIEDQVIALGGDKSRVGVIPLSTVLHGAGPILMAIQAQVSAGKKLLIVDAASTEDLDQIALALAKSRKNLRLLPCGAAGFAQALVRHWPTESQQAMPEIHLPKQPTLIVVGSYSQITQRQMEVLRSQFQHPITTAALTPSQILGLSPIEPALDTLILALHRDGVAIVSTVAPILPTTFSTDLHAPPPPTMPHTLDISSEGTPLDNYEETLRLAEQHGITHWDAKLMAQQRLASLVKAVLDVRPCHLIICGGETSFRVCEAIGSHTLEIMAEMAPQVPLMLDDQRRWVMTKSGGFGTPELLLNLLQHLSMPLSG